MNKKEKEWGAENYRIIIAYPRFTTTDWNLFATNVKVFQILCVPRDKTRKQKPMSCQSVGRQNKN